MTTVEKIKAIRARTGLSQAKFAIHFHIPRRTIEAWEGGKRTPPEYMIRCLAAAVVVDELGVDVHEFFPMNPIEPERSRETVDPASSEKKGG